MKVTSDKELEVSLTSLERARTLAENENFGRAFAHYLVVLELNPTQKTFIENEFAYVLSEWGLLLEKQNRLQDLHKCFLQALHYYSSSVEVLNSYGLQLLRLEDNVSAKNYFDMSHTLDKKFLPSEKNLLIAKLNILPRWHFRMLNDKIRNRAYFEALKLNQSQKFCRIIDIGSGCGLLSLFATKYSNFQSITAVEESAVLAEIANDICRKNEINNVTIINKNSTELNENLCNYNLLVTEIFDTALFGEHVLKTLIHAWENLLETSAKVIPSYAKVYITGINSLKIYKKHRFVGDFNFIEGLSHICLTQTLKEPYEAENISDGDVFVTSTENLVTVNFNDVVQLKKLYKGTEMPVVLLKALKDSEINAFAIWFDLYLDENNFISTDPKKRNVTCWEQAIFYLDHPCKVNINEEIKLQISCVNDKLKLNLINYISDCPKCFKISPEVISFLNDKKLLCKLLSLSQKISENNLVILDLNVFPIFGILMAKKGCKVHCIINNDTDLEFLNYLCEKNKILENINVLSDDAFNSLLKMTNVYDVIFIDAINSYGILNDKFLRKYSNFKNLLKSDGVILPKDVFLSGQVVCSEYLEKCCKVNDENTFGFKIAESMNEYAVPELWELDYENFPHIPMSDKITFWNIIRDEEIRENNFEITVTENGKASGILYWFKINFDDEFLFDTRESIFYKKACFLFSSSKYEERNNILRLQVKQHRGLLKIDRDSGNQGLKIYGGKVSNKQNTPKHKMSKVLFGNQVIPSSGTEEN